jgi:hypothetical protein
VLPAVMAYNTAPASQQSEPETLMISTRPVRATGTVALTADQSGQVSAPGGLRVLPEDASTVIAATRSHFGIVALATPSQGRMLSELQLCRVHRDRLRPAGLEVSENVVRS